MAKGTKTGKRYSEVEKQRILKFVEKSGRGGLSAAKAKWGVSYIALKRWKDGKGVGSKKASKTPKAIRGKVKGLKGLLSLVNKLKAKLESMS